MKAFIAKSVCIENSLRNAVVMVENGKIKEILDHIPRGFAGEMINLNEDQVLIPGLVDSHVHINEPGRTDWEGFYTATKAAAAGGITTLVDMPLNCIPVTTTQKNLQTKIEAVQDQLFVDLGFWGGVVPESIQDLPELLKAGVFGVKSFMIHSGVDDFPHMEIEDLEKTFPILKQFDLPYLIHAELELDTPQNIDQTYQSFLASRPKSMENQAIEELIKLCEKYQTKTHVVHLSSADLIEKLAALRDRGLPFTLETCPHYLCLDAESIENGQTQFKCCPPIREKSNQTFLWNALKNNIIDFIVSDHSPCTANLKQFETGDFGDAWGGISSLQFGFSLIWTEAKKQGFDISDMVKWMCTGPADFLGLDNKGQVAVGADADFVVVNLEKEFAVDTNSIYYKNKITPYAGKKLKGVIEKTYLRGECIFDQHQFRRPMGQILLRK